MILLEAMSARVPVVATRVGDIPAVLGDLSVLVEPDDDKAMAAALAPTIDELPRHRELAVRAAHRVATNYSAAAMADRCAAVYQSVCATR